MAEDETPTSFLVVPVPERTDALEFTEENFDTFIDIFLDAMMPTFNLFAMSKPPADLVPLIMESVVGAQLGFFLAARTSVNGVENNQFPEFSDPEQVTEFSGLLMNACWARLTLVVDEIAANQSGMDDD